MKVSLVECQRGDRVRIVEVAAGRGATLNLLSLGLGVGHLVKLIQRLPMHGPVLVGHDDTEVAIGYQLAKKILVEKAP